MPINVYPGSRRWRHGKTHNFCMQISYSQLGKIRHLFNIFDTEFIERHYLSSVVDRKVEVALLNVDVSGCSWFLVVD
jgi:hypothetical protein